MDTKLKKYKHSYALKTLAFFLAFALVFASAWFAIKAANKIRLYGTSIVLQPKDKTDATSSSAFATTLIEDLLSVYDASDISNWEDYKNKAYPSYEETLQNAKDLLESFKSNCMAMAISKYNNENETFKNDEYYHPDDGTSGSTASSATVPATNANGNAEQMIGIKNYDSEYYFGCSGDISLYFGGTVSVTTRTTDEELEAAVKKAFESNMVLKKREYETKINLEKKNIENLKNLKFYIINPETGNVYSNMESIDEKTAAESIKSYGWYLEYTVLSGLAGSSEKITSSTLYDYMQVVPSSDYRVYNLEEETHSLLSLSEVIESCFSSNGYNIYLALDTSYAQTDKYSELQNDFVNSGSLCYDSIMLSIVCLILAMFLSFYLLFVTGHVNGTEGIKISVLDKMPTDIHLLVSGGLVVAYIASMAAASDIIFSNTQISENQEILLLVFLAGAAALAWATMLELALSTAKYYKIKRNWFYSTFTFWILKQCVRFCKFVFRKIKSFFMLITAKLATLPKKTFWYGIVYVVINLILAFATVASQGVASFILFLIIAAFNIIVFTRIWKYVVNLDKIISESENTKNGIPPKDILIEKMPESLKTLASNLYYTREELSKAISEAVKGEKMKTELITNVSHDLKTPLTSIISYVDLLKKCDIDDMSAQKYITVLDEKSARLKRLIEDLVEASKASSGALTFNKMNVDFYELAVQAISEMEDVFNERKLEIVLSESKDNPIIFADSQKTWRVIDNLLNNVKKYALVGTRVYVDIFSDNVYGLFTIKNTSRDALNIDPEELTNRFVRGDESRTLEGSGLGLSIAKDLCDLQGGKLELSIDGDLFKATVKMPLAKNIDIKAELAEDGAAEKSEISIENPNN